MYKIYVLVGIKGTPLRKDKSLFKVDRIIARDIISGDDGELNLGEIADSGIKVFGLPSRVLEGCYNYNYNVWERSFTSGKEDYEVGFLPVYYSNNLSKMPYYEYDYKSDKYIYIADKDIRCFKDEIVRVRLDVGHYDSLDRTPYCDIELDLFMPLRGGFDIGVHFRNFGKLADNKGNKHKFKYDYIDSNGNYLDNIKYFSYLSWVIYGSHLEELQGSGIATLNYGDFGRVVEFITDKLHAINLHKLQVATDVITRSSCRVFVFSDRGMTAGCNIVLNPNIVKIVNNCFSYYSVNVGSFKTLNVKLFISRRMQIGVILDFVKSVRFEGLNNRGVIGFAEFAQGNDKEYRKCCEITDILDSNDTSHKIFNDIEYLVEKLNQIGFNIELY